MIKYNTWGLENHVNTDFSGWNQARTVGLGDYMPASFPIPENPMAHTRMNIVKCSYCQRRTKGREENCKGCGAPI